LEVAHVWQRRFYDFVVRSEEKKIEKLKYIHPNPVKALPDARTWKAMGLRRRVPCD
jgi:hypothetical protein